MHCWKTINIKREYGSTWLTIMSALLFVLVFAFSFVLLEDIPPMTYEDNYLWLFVFLFLLIYPLHKVLHYVTLFKYRDSVKLRFKIDYKFVPIIRMRIKSIIPKKRYLFTLLAPFFIINGFLIFMAIAFEEYAHFYCLLFAYHCSICFIDLLYVKNLLKAPKDSLIEETPKGCEVLVPEI
ncbi:DUF3267 domain-containing protein [Lysinibacillus yapensis]|uniref:DUF3267 domain-containing protein n=1 Tax=Ureibacillus yapensis TaxID=2304605 RepID=A0A396SEH1_9BACL|nr:DUF3267 domain-containing protein [Lysinibacillus yapensis]RHW36612.1 DUF3267 domain-containing protein [Lysinibacillus yapensis]